MSPKSLVRLAAMPAVALVLLATPLFADDTAASAPAETHDFGQLNPAAPPQTSQFSFLIGEWDCSIRRMQPDGQRVESTANWTAYYILDGWAIQDDWVSEMGGGRKFHGTNIRSFNPQTKKWDNRWLAAGTLQWRYFESEMVGDTMVMTGEGKNPRGAFIDRNTFYSIGKDSWKWRKDHSYDGGETWIEGIAEIEAKRVR